MKDKSRYYERLASVERPSRYLGGEFGLPTIERSKLPRFVLGFPDVYEVGMSHLGFRLLHAALCDRQDVSVERVFLPWTDLQQDLQRTHTPLFSLESQNPIKDADLIGLSVQYELAMPAVLKVLDLAGIPRRVCDRNTGRWPLVLLGGTTALNPEPLAPFIDACFLGEADHAIVEIADLVAEHAGGPRSELLEALSKVQGIYVPGWYQPEYDTDDPLAVRVLPSREVPAPERRYEEDLDAIPPPPTHIVPCCHIVHDRVAIEIQRGCCQGCRFCQAGFTTRPTRQRSPSQVVDAARAALASTGYQNLSLLSLSAGDHPHLQGVLAQLIEEHGPNRVAVSLPSLRTDSLHPTVAQQMAKVRKTTFTLAPEAATDRLRRVINKCNTEADLMASVTAVARVGYSQFKLYFMIGLPTETDEDVEAIVDLAARVLSEVKRWRGKMASVTVGVSTFVPKPHTPFQWAAANDIETIEHRQQLLVQRMPRRIRLKWHDSGQSLVEAYLARADRRMAAVLERVVDASHNGLDAWSEHFDFARWKAALASAHDQGMLPEPSRLLLARRPESPLPWDHLDIGVTRDYLLSQWEAARGGRTRPDCSDGTCDSCGVCPEQPLHRIADSPMPSGVVGAPDKATEESPEKNTEKSTVRLWFHKLGVAALMSHLEMVGVFERAARRAKLPLLFSSGFHPKPRLRFAPALTLGAESLAEFVEIDLTRRMPPERVVELMEGQLPPGIEVERATTDGETLHGKIKGVRWRFEGPLPAELSRQARRRLEREVWIERTRKGKVKQLRLDRMISEVRQDAPGSMEISCEFNRDGTLRPTEILRGLLVLDEEGVAETRIVRVGWLWGEEVETSR